MVKLLFIIAASAFFQATASAADPVDLDSAAYSALRAQAQAIVKNYAIDDILVMGVGHSSTPIIDFLQGMGIDTALSLDLVIPETTRLRETPAAEATLQMRLNKFLPSKDMLKGKTILLLDICDHCTNLWDVKKSIIQKLSGSSIQVESLIFGTPEDGITFGSRVISIKSNDKNAIERIARLYQPDSSSIVQKKLNVQLSLDKDFDQYFGASFRNKLSARTDRIATAIGLNDLESLPIKRFQTAIVLAEKNRDSLSALEHLAELLQDSLVYEKQWRKESGSSIENIRVLRRNGLALLASSAGNVNGIAESEIGGILVKCFSLDRGNDRAYLSAFEEIGMQHHPVPEFFPRLKDALIRNGTPEAYRVGAKLNLISEGEILTYVGRCILNCKNKLSQLSDYLLSTPELWTLLNKHGTDIDALIEEGTSSISSTVIQAGLINLDKYPGSKLEKTLANTEPGRAIQNAIDGNWVDAELRLSHEIKYETTHEGTEVLLRRIQTMKEDGVDKKIQRVFIGALQSQIRFEESGNSEVSFQIAAGLADLGEFHNRAVLLKLTEAAHYPCTEKDCRSRKNAAAAFHKIELNTDHAELEYVLGELTKPDSKTDPVLVKKLLDRIHPQKPLICKDAFTSLSN